MKIKPGVFWRASFSSRTLDRLVFIPVAVLNEVFSYKTLKVQVEKYSISKVIFPVQMLVSVSLKFATASAENIIAAAEKMTD